MSANEAVKTGVDLGRCEQKLLTVADPNYRSNSATTLRGELLGLRGDQPRSWLERIAQRAFVRYDRRSDRVKSVDPG